MSAEHDFAFCATAWSGVAEDIPNAVKLLGELSGFKSLADRNQQGFLNQLYLGRLLIHPQGLTANPRSPASVDPSRLYYDGNSQGGILGTALTAIAPDFERAVLGVPGINFSVLLTRSSNWDTYGAVFNPAYPRQSERPLALALINMLWDRGEGDGWAHHVTTDPPPARRRTASCSTPRSATGRSRPTRPTCSRARSARPPTSLPTRQVARSSACRCTASPPSRATRSRARRSSTGTTARRERHRAAGQCRAGPGQGLPLRAAHDPGGAAQKARVPAHRQRDRRVRRAALPGLGGDVAVVACRASNEEEFPPCRSRQSSSVPCPGP